MFDGPSYQKAISREEQTLDVWNSRMLGKLVLFKVIN